MKGNFQRRTILAAAAVAATVVITISKNMHFNQSSKSQKYRHLAEHSIFGAKVKMHRGPLGPTFLIGIFSTTGAKYSHRRQYIRDTILRRDDERMCELGEFIRQTKENRGRRVCQVPYTFVIGAGGEDRPTDHNDSAPLTLDTDPNGDSESDCTYLNIRENMEDGKSPTWLKFGASIAKQYGIDYIAKTDDDSVLSKQEMILWLDEDLPPFPYNRRIYGGAPRLSRVKNHIYAAGEFYFMSADLAEYVGDILTPEVRLSMMIPWRHTEDLDMGTFVHSHPHPIKFMNLNERMFWYHPVKEEWRFRQAWEGGLWRLPQHRPVLSWNSQCSHVLDGKGL